MKITELIVGDKVLAQTSEFVREIAKVKGIDKENGLVIVKMTDGTIREIHPQYILKSFGV